MRILKHRRRAVRCVLRLVLQTLMVSFAAAVWAGGLNLGPVYDDYSLTLGEGWRAEAAGPFLGFEELGDETQWRFSPLFSFARKQSPDSAEFDFLYPLLTYDRFESESRFQFFQLLSLSKGQNQQDQRKSKFSLFPFYLSQQSEDPEESYRALIPFYGTVKNRFFRDEIQFFFYPLYLKTVKRGVTTKNFLYPFFHLRSGDGLRGWQLWPLIGYENKEPSERLNGFGETETVPGYEKRSALWPIYFHHRVDLGTDHPGTKRALLPFYYMERTRNRDYTSVLWPFFNHVDDREDGYQEWSGPWPLIAFARGEGKTMNRVWPLFGSAKGESMSSRFLLWPLWKTQTKETEAFLNRRHRAVYFLYSDSYEENKQTGKSRRRVDLWPAFTYRRDFEGRRRLQAFSPLEPILPRNDAVERNYSPLWSVFRYERNPNRAAKSVSLFWNLFRYERQATALQWSFLFGMAQYERTFQSHRARAFYIPFDL